VIKKLDLSVAVQSRLRLALCGAAEMAGYLSRWDRYYPKAFEAMANHRFAALGFACESNLLSSRGRGTLHRRFVQSVAAARWSQENASVDGSVRMASSGDRRRRVNSGALLACGSSERQLPSNESVDLVLTDPPYFDDVQYAELASLLFTWARTVDLIPSSVTLDVASEAVVNSSRGNGLTEYREMLTRIFREARRTLKPAGLLVLTFHNTDIRAWWALARALHDADLAVHALAVAEAENGSDHAKRNSRAFTSDLVIECRPAVIQRQTITSVGDGHTPEAHELYAAGRTLACAGAVELPEFIDQYRAVRGQLERPRIRIPVQEKT
jgi:adenine-specific DNA methylase